MTSRDEPVVVEGIVEPGDRRGRELGFPTANVRGVDEVRLDGVYAAVVDVAPASGGPSYVAAVSVGHRPTFYGREGVRLLEAHLLDFDGDLYGTRVRLLLHARLRPQRAYVDRASLITQLGLDVRATRVWAAENDWAHLLAAPPARSNGPRELGVGAARQPVVRRKRRDALSRSVERQSKRELELRKVIDACDAVQDIRPDWLADRVGVPVAYAEWYLSSHGR